MVPPPPKKKGVVIDDASHFFVGRALKVVAIHKFAKTNNSHLNKLMLGSWKMKFPFRNGPLCRGHVRFRGG